MRPDKYKSFTYFKLLFPSSIAAPDSLDSWGSGTLLHISIHPPGEVTFTFQIPTLPVLKPALQFECYLLGLCPSISGPVPPPPHQKNPPTLWIFIKGRTVVSVYFVHQLALINWHTIPSLVIKPSHLHRSGLDRPFVSYWPYPPLLWDSSGANTRCVPTFSPAQSNPVRKGWSLPFLKHQRTIASFGYANISWASSKLSPCPDRLLMTVPRTA